MATAVPLWCPVSRLAFWMKAASSSYSVARASAGACAKASRLAATAEIRAFFMRFFQGLVLLWRSAL